MKIAAKAFGGMSAIRLTHYSSSWKTATTCS